MSRTTPCAGTDRCEPIFRLLYAYLDRELGPAESALVEEHLAACPRCARFFRFEGQYLHWLGERLCQEAAPAALRERVTQALRHGHAGPAANQ